jgi:hypothetical protein
MTRAEQQKLIRQVSEYRSLMSRSDLETFAMLEKRDKDDEELDSLACATLEQLAAKYVKKKTRAEVEELWKKMTSGQPKH